MASLATTPAVTHLDRHARDHEQAEDLLAACEQCSEPLHRSRLQQEAVLLTLDLAESVAQRYQGRGIDVDDLLQVARMALVKAARGYRTGIGSSFAAYAMPTMSGSGNAGPTLSRTASPPGRRSQAPLPFSAMTQSSPIGS